MGADSSLAMTINGTSGDMSPTGAPVISGAAKLEQTLTASISGILDPDGTTKADAGDAGYAYTYQWERVDEDGVSNPVEISGATQSDYTVGIDDVDSRLRVKVSFSDDAGYAEGPLVSYVTPTVRIVDVTVSFGQGTYRVDEGDMVDVTVTLSADPERTVEIPISTDNQGGATASDYTVTPDALTFNSGETEKSLTFTATDDTDDDDDESVKLGFENLPASVSAGGVGEATVSITDDDVPSVTVSFGQGTYRVDEGDMVDVTVTLSADPERTVEIPISTSNQGGATGSDYTVTPDALTFNSGETSKSLTFTATQDDVDDDGESVRLGFDALPGGVSVGSTGETTVSITDDDVPSVTVSFGQGTYRVDEGDMVDVTVTLSADPERTVEIPISTDNQGGATASDYTVTPDALTFNSGETEKSLTFTATDDTDDDDDESVKLGFEILPAGVSAGGVGEATVSITDDDVPSVTVSFGQGTYRVDEGDMVDVTVTLSADPERTVEIPISASDQGGATGSDYTVTPDALTFNSGETSKSLTFTATQDDVDDDGESVRLGFDALPGGVSVGSTGETTVSITDDDVPSVTVSFGQGTYRVDEGDMVDVTVTLSADPERTVEIPISTDNQGGATASDYTVTPDALTFNSGETSKSLTFEATQDDVDDDDESVKLGFENLPASVSAGGVGEATVSITDDDVPSVTVSFGQGTYRVDEGDMVDVTVTLSADPERTVEIPISASDQGGATGSDYTVTPDALTFNSGETSKSLTFTATQDDVDDDGESVRLGFDALPGGVSVGSTGETTVSITDDDVPSVTVSFGQGTYRVDEGDMVDVTVTPSADPERTVEIPISTDNQGGATASDYTVTPDALTFNSGETSKSLTFEATQDDVDDDDESVKLGFENLPAGVSAGGVGEATVSIADDDVPSVTVGFVQDSYSVIEGDMVDVTVTLSADPERTVVIPISTSNQDGATDSDYTVGITSMTFSSGETSKSFTFSATDDNDNDDGESVKFSFGSALPPDVSEGTPSEATVFITDEECSSPIWTATLQLGDDSAKDWGVFRLVHHPTTPGPPSILDGDEFDLQGEDYKIWRVALDPAVQTGSVARSPYATPEMASFEISIYREGPDGRSHRVRAEDYRDWTLFIDDMAFPFGDVAYTDGSSFLWRDQEFNDMFNAWSPSTTYQLCLDDTPASETIMAPPSAPKYLRLFPGYGSLVALWRVPDNDSHWLPPEFEGTEIIRYEVQIKELGDSWTNASDVLEYSVPPLEDNPQGVYTFGGLTNGVDYSVRVKAANAAGEGPYSAEAWGAPQYSRPGLSDAVVDGEFLSLNFNRGLDDTSVPAASNFRVLVNGESHVPDSVMVTGSKVILTLPEPAVHVDEVHVLYILPDDIDAPRIRDGDGYYYTTSGREYIQARNETPLASLPPVTVSVESLPDSHNGVASFTFRIVFSESVKVLYSYGAGMLNVTGGSVTGSQNLDRRTERWEFTIAPHSEGDVEINLPGGRECEYGHIPCGAGERPLSNSLELTVSFLQTGSQMANSPATGALVIAGVPRVGETLTVDTSLIEDQNGLESASFTYQWSRQDLASQVETDITGTTGSSYVLTADDRDSAIGVSVGFTDDAGNEETLTSYWVPVLQSPNNPATGAPTISGAAQVGETLLVDTTGISDSDGLSNAVYHYQWLAHDGSSVTEIAGATGSSYTLKVDDESHAIQVRVSFTDDAGHEESLTSVATEPVSFAVQKQQANSPATGAPTISGTAQVGETLTADISGISDEDGLSSVAYRYQWLADDADITGATAAAYTLTDSEEGKTVRVRVSFTDDAGNEETLTSSATATVEARPDSPAAGQPAISGTAQVGETLTADTSGISDEDGLNQVAYRYQWLADDAAIAGATAGAYTLVEADTGAIITVTVSFTDDAGHEEMLTSKATVAVAAELAEPPAAPTGLRAAPSHDRVVLGWDDPQDDAITGYVILRRDRAIHEPGTFVTVAADTGSADTGYTDGTVEPEKEYVYRIRAINEHGVSELSRWVRANTPAPPLPAKPTGLTAAASHDQVVLSWDDPQDDSITGYVILRRNRATTDVGEFTELVADTGSAATTHTDDSVAADTSYTYRIRAINGHGVSELSRWVRADTPASPPANSPASGAPEISGTAQVGETLTASTSGIGDEDGLDSVSYSYQWLADDADIAEATATTYTLLEADEGKTVRVRVSFTDDAGNDESLTSAATEPVSFAVQQQQANSPATGAPTISGTVQVDETLTADTTGIVDEDGLDSVSYTYQWLADGVDIAGATAGTHTLQRDDEGRTIQVRVTFTDDADNEETLTSAATRPVRPAADRQFA